MRSSKFQKQTLLEKNRRDFGKELFFLTKSNNKRGDSKLCYNPKNLVAIAQWNENKVISVVSILGIG